MFSKFRSFHWAKQQSRVLSMRNDHFIFQQHQQQQASRLMRCEIFSSNFDTLAQMFLFLDAYVPRFAALGAASFHGAQFLNAVLYLLHIYIYAHATWLL